MSGNSRQFIGIRAIGSEVPVGRVSVERVLELNREPRRMIKVFQKLFGLSTVSSLREGESLEQMVIRALEHLKRDLGGGNRSAPDLVLYAHATVPQSLASLDPVQEKVKALWGVEPLVFGISHMNCASLFAGARLARAYLERSRGARSVLLIGADELASQGDLYRYLPGVTVMGDGAVAIWLERGAGDPILGAAVVRDHRFASGIYSTPAEIRNFSMGHDELIAASIRAALENAGGLGLEEVDWIMPYNVNVAIWNRFAETHGFRRERILTDQVREVGHTYTMDAFLNLGLARSRGVLKRGEKVLLLALGLGAYVESLIISVESEGE